MIRFTIPSQLGYRDLAIRTVASACKLVTNAGSDFHYSVISAFSEALNNVMMHSRSARDLEIEIEIDLMREGISVRVLDYGVSFDPAAVPPPDLESLPESGLGVFIMRSLMDEMTYVPGSPNILILTKHVKGAARS